MDAQIQALKVYRDHVIQVFRDEDPERGGAIEQAIITVVLIAIGVALAALLWAAFENRSSGLE